MSTQVDMTINDGQGAPVAHTFTAVGVDVKGVAKWFEKTTSSISAGFFQLTSSLRIPTVPSDPVRYQVKLVVPTVVTETLNGVAYQKAIRKALVSIDMVMPSDATLQERKDLAAYVYNFAAKNTSGGLRYSIENLDVVV
jgi:hypothetical protein